MLLLLLLLPLPAFAAVVAAAGSSWRLLNKQLPHSQSMWFLEKIKQSLIETYSPMFTRVNQTSYLLAFLESTKFRATNKNYK